MFRRSGPIYVDTATLHRRLDEAGIEHRFELFDGGDGGIAYRHAPLIAWLATSLAFPRPRRTRSERTETPA